MGSKGKIVGILGQIVEVEFLNDQPLSHNLLLLEQDPKIKMEVYQSSGPNTFFCLLFNSPTTLQKGMVVVDTGEPIKVPVGEQVLGRVLDVMGKNHDGLPQLSPATTRPIFNKGVIFDHVEMPTTI